MGVGGAWKEGVRIRCVECLGLGEGCAEWVGEGWKVEGGGSLMGMGLLLGVGVGWLEGAGGSFMGMGLLPSVWMGGKPGSLGPVGLSLRVGRERARGRRARRRVRRMVALG